MKKIKELQSPTWKGFVIEGVTSLSVIKGGATTTKNATYYAAPGGGSFDDGSEDRNHEAMQ
ncbi:MAG: hypothetical protein JSS64_01885 [Bacteroidetes bacterium]|nr:hypothetical protein [Bacteroidota bacterium]